MPRILTTCPKSLTLVPTGHRTSDMSLAALVGSRAFRCTSCAQIHAWDAAQAVVEEAMSSPFAYI